ncbi:hypothetical protein IWW55_006707 [Coemansia sp. RSA 2706]|nr:hypothetical protein IWW55_006707 [Coemansia sp. RSA 2706]
MLKHTRYLSQLLSSRYCGHPADTRFIFPSAGKIHFLVRAPDPASSAGFLGREPAKASAREIA